MTLSHCSRHYSRHYFRHWRSLLPLWLSLVAIAWLAWGHVAAKAPSSRPSSQPTSRPGLAAGPSSTTRPTPLSARRILTLSSEFRRFDPSGLALTHDGKGLMVVNDKWSVLQLMGLTLPTTAGDRVVSLAPLVRGKGPVTFPKSRHWKHFHLMLDLEGATRCGHSATAPWLVVSEQQRRVFRIHPKTGHTTQHPIAWQAYQRHTTFKRRPVARFSIAVNAGFEGLACDPKGKRLFVIQERQPRMVLVAALPKTWTDRASLKLTDHFDVPAFGLPQKVGRYELPPDFAGAHFVGGHLYLLARNARRIVKVDPKRHKIVGSVSYQKTEQRLYRLPKPFGLAEGLTMDAKRIFVAFDNNGRPRRASAPNKRGDRRPVIVEFARPSGF